MILAKLKTLLKIAKQVVVVILAFSLSYMTMQIGLQKARQAPTKVGIISPSNAEEIILFMPRRVSYESLQELYAAAIYGKPGQSYIIVDNTNGGDVAAIMHLVELIKLSKAHFRIHITEYAASAGAYLACQIGNVTFSGKNPRLLVHRAYGELGEGNAAYALATAVELNKVDMELWTGCRPYMTVEQWDQFLKGKDVWFPASQMLDPLTHTKSLIDKVKKGK